MVRMYTHLKILTLITNDELAVLNGGGINDIDDIGYLKYADIQYIPIGSTTVTWRKIERVALFIDGGDIQNCHHDGRHNHKLVNR